MTARSSRRLRVLRQEPAEAAVLSCASEQNGSSYDRDSAKRQSREQQCHGCSRALLRRTGLEEQARSDSDTSEPDVERPAVVDERR